MNVTSIDILNGILSMIFIVICIIVCIILIKIYVETRKKEYILVGLTILIFSTPWWPSVISLILALLTNKGLTPELYFFIGNFFTPFGIICWIIAFTDLMYKKYQKIIIPVYIIIGLSFEILLIYYIIEDPSVIGELNGIVDVQYKSFVLIYLLILAVTLIITGILFAKETMKSDDPEVRWRGLFLLIAFILFNISAVLDAGIATNAIYLIIIRILLISSMFLFYSSFNMPKFLKRLLIAQ